MSTRSVITNSLGSFLIYLFQTWQQFTDMCKRSQATGSTVYRKLTVVFPSSRWNVIKLLQLHPHKTLVVHKIYVPNCEYDQLSWTSMHTEGATTHQHLFCLMMQFANQLGGCKVSVLDVKVCGVLWEQLGLLGPFLRPQNLQWCYILTPFLTHNQWCENLCHFVAAHATKKNCIV